MLRWSQTVWTCSVSDLRPTALGGRNSLRTLCGAVVYYLTIVTKTRNIKNIALRLELKTPVIIYIFKRVVKGSKIDIEVIAPTTECITGCVLFLLLLWSLWLVNSYWLTHRRFLWSVTFWLLYGWTKKSCAFPLNRGVPSIEVTNTKITWTFFRDQILCPLSPEWRCPSSSLGIKYKDYLNIFPGPNLVSLELRCPKGEVPL